MGPTGEAAELPSTLPRGLRASNPAVAVARRITCLRFMGVTIARPVPDFDRLLESELAASIAVRTLVIRAGFPTPLPWCRTWRTGSAGPCWNRFHSTSHFTAL